MSDKNRVITNGLFRKKMAELLGEDIVNTPQFNDFQALDVTTFTKEVDKLIDNPPWGSSPSPTPAESDFFFVNFTVTQSEQTTTVTCDKTIDEIDAATKPVMAYANMGGGFIISLSYVGDHTFLYSMATTEFINNIYIIGDKAEGLPDTWEFRDSQAFILSQLVATFTFDGSSSFTCDKTYSEIATAFSNNVRVLGIFTDPQTGVVHKIPASIKNASDSIIFTSTNIPESGKIEVVTIEYASNGTITPSDVIVSA